MDPHNRGRHCPRNRDPVILLNLGVIATALATYAANELLFKPSGGGPLLHGYLNDVLAGSLLLAWANLLIGCGPYWRWEIQTVARASFLILPAGLYWEFIAPLYTASTSDLRDLIAYWLGACLYLLVPMTGDGETHESREWHHVTLTQVAGQLALRSAPEPNCPARRILPAAWPCPLEKAFAVEFEEGRPWSS
jgi:hypothetical protein